MSEVAGKKFSNELKCFEKIIDIKRSLTYSTLVRLFFKMYVWSVISPGSLENLGKSNTWTGTSTLVDRVKKSIDVEVTKFY